jgi:hypothetical protein
MIWEGNGRRIVVLLDVTLSAIAAGLLAELSECEA